MKANASVARESGVDVTLTGTNGDLFTSAPHRVCGAATPTWDVCSGVRRQSG